jgi:RHS repeat-associated protein
VKRKFTGKGQRSPVRLADGRAGTGLTTFADGLFLTTSNRYDRAGRQIATIDAAGLVTTYAYPNPLTSVTISSGVSRRSGGAAEADGLLTNTTVRYLDGQTKCTLQNGVIQSWYNYGVSPNGTRWAITYTGPAGLASPVWQRTTTDLLGRTIRTERPGFSGAGVPPAVLITSNLYNTAGQLIRTSEYSSLSASAPLRENLFSYDSLGAQTRSGLDLNRNGVLDLSGPDRVSESRAWYEQDASNNWWQTSASILYPHDGSAVPVTNAIQKTQLTGLGGPGAPHAVSLSKDMLGNTTISRTLIDPATRTVTQTTTYPDSTNAAISVTINGRAQYSISKTGVRTDYAYDALARQISARVDAASPPRSVGSFTHYNTLGQVDWVADALSNRTTFVYDTTTGRRTAVTDALSNTTYTAYDPEGRVIATWGATYPVAYAYDAYGRMVVMATFRNEGGAGDQTQWLYDEATGLLTNKVYADGKGPSYTYTPDGQLATRTWARGVQTTYRYATDGAMTNIAYSDGTPAVSFTLDRLGRQVAITDGTGTRTFAYNDALQLAAETNALGTITRQYDSFGRSSGLAVGSAYQVGYGYSGDGRFASVSSSVFSVSSVVKYYYLPGTDLLSGWSSPSGFAVTRTFEAHRDLLIAVSNRYNGGTVSAFDYINDAIGRRTQRIDSGSATATNAFGYNPRSELTSAAMGTNAYGYAYDPIGNRTAATNNAEALTYSANALNQYTNITAGTVQVPQYDLDGNLTNYNGWSFAWDGENRMVWAANGSTVVSNQYDYMSRRVAKTVGSTTHQFLYDGWAMIQETTGTQTNSYVYGLDLSGSMQGAGTIGGLLSASLNGTQAYYFYDANGNVSDLVATNGASLAHYEFDPYGNATVSTVSLVAVNPFRFSTKYTDDETGLYYYGYRFLSTEMGRWVNRDPITEGGGLNLNCFVNNNSLANVDANGLLILNPVNPGNGVPPIVISPPPPQPQPQPQPQPPPPTTSDCVCAKGQNVGNRPKPFPYTPRSNGCGPGWGTIIPEDPMSGVFPWNLSCPFTSSCNYHDECYGTCNAGKEQCDADFRMLLRSQCDICSDNVNFLDRYVWRTLCYAMANTYALAVSVPGISSRSYRQGQNEGCEACCCP